MFNISIPKPCFEGWENMMPNEQGRYCNACAKTVVDFSVMSDEAVQQYVTNNYEPKMCGRFKTTQLQRIVIYLPQNIFRLQLPFWKKFLAAFLICFGGSFLGIDTTMAGASFKQGSVIASHKIINEPKVDKKKPVHYRKKKRRRREVWCIPVPEFTSTMGYMRWEPSAPTFPYDSILKTVSTETGYGNTGINLKTNTSSSKPVKEQTPKVPNPTTAFVLPAAFNIRNPFSKKKKA